MTKEVLLIMSVIKVWGRLNFCTRYVIEFNHKNIFVTAT